MTVIFSSTKENRETQKRNTRILLSMLFERMALFCDECTRPQPNNHRESDWTNYALEMETIEEEGGEAAADQFEEFRSEFDIMKLLWALMDRIFVNNIACGVNEMFNLLPTYDHIWKAGEEFLGLPNNPVHYVVDPFLSVYIADREVKIYYRDALRDRPIQETIEASMSVYKPGKGWDAPEAKKWFGEQTKETEENSGGDSEEESASMSLPKKHNETRKYNENMLVLRSISRILLCDESEGPKNYRIKCDYSWARKNNQSLCDPSFKDTCRNVVKQDEWDCSEDYVRTLPFETVKALVPGKWNPIT